MKRYTDPSSLRKHVKTVHGADFYANKKHKGGSGSDGGAGGGGSGGAGGGGGGGGVGSDEAGVGHSSPSRSEDLHPKTPSVSSPSVKSESEANSPPSMMQQQDSPLHVAICNDDSNGVNVGPVSDVAFPDEAFNEEPEDLDIADLPVALRAMVSLLLKFLSTDPSMQLKFMNVITNMIHFVGWWTRITSASSACLEESFERKVKCETITYVSDLFRWHERKP